MDDKIKRLAAMIKDSEAVVFFGGAGVSTESGVPDFRSKDGLYNQHDVRFDGYSPEYLLSHECLTRQPEVFFEFYRQKLDTHGIKPNAAHKALAKLEQQGKLKAVVTQNIDGLHQAAGSKNVHEIHGTTARNYCGRCGKKYPADHIFRSTAAVPRCACGGVIRCDVTLYGEQLPEDAVAGAIEAISSADMLIIGGTSLSVYPAASYIGYFHGRYLAIINKDPLQIGPASSRVLQINEPIGKVMSAVMEELGID
ncbi:MAG: NAD-dependent protein deacylase [Clostridia bacterium]|nr:NAD-dependent protein deacylase [Clostridia bacterium]